MLQELEKAKNQYFRKKDVLGKYASTVAPQCCTRDEGRSLEVGLQERASNCLTLLGIERSRVVSG